MAKKRKIENDNSDSELTTPEVVVDEEVAEVKPKLNCYTVRARCPNCGNRTFVKVLLPADPQKDVILADKCKECDSNLLVVNIYQRHEGE